VKSKKQTEKSAPARHYVHNVRLAKKARKIRRSTSKKRKPRKLPPYLTLPEKDRFFKAIDTIRDRALFRLLYHHGLRASEIGKLQLSDYRQGPDLDSDRIYIHRLKGSITGECAVMDTAAFAVRAWIRVRGIKPGVLFPSRQGTPLSRKRIFELMRIYCERASVPLEKAHPHCFKHTCCTHLISYQKESIMDVRAHVGHVSIRSTMIYADLTAEATEARAKRLKGWK
jgi:integrase